MTMSAGNFRDHVYLAVLPVLMTENEDGVNLVDWTARATDVQELASRIAEAVYKMREDWDEDA